MYLQIHYARTPNGAGHSVYMGAPMVRALQVCSRTTCPNLSTSGKCDQCRAADEQQRGTSRQRGYGYRHETRFRAGVLKRDPLCTCTTPGHGHGGQCLIPSKHADHWPLSRTDLVAKGMDPNDPKHGRGLCPRCHSRETSVHQPGGWNAR